MKDPMHQKNLVILGILAALLFFFHLSLSLLSGYGYFIDELYFIACSKRLDFGYIDQPPLSIVLLAISRFIGGGSMTTIRILPALAMAATVFITGLITLRLGGSTKAMIISAIAVMVMPVYLLFGSFYSMNAFEPLTVATILWLIIRMEQEEKPFLWVYVGVLAGCGLEMKHTLIVYLLSLLVALLFSRGRKIMMNKWFLLGLMICLVLILPNVIWQVMHGFPSLELYRNSMGGKNIARMPWNVIADQVLFANVFSLPLWIAGLIFFFKAENGKYRFIVWMFLLLLLMMILGKSSRPDRIAAIYTVLFAAGAVTFDRLSMMKVGKFAREIMMVLLITGGVVFIPMFTPVFPPRVLRNYMSALGIRFNVERGKMNEPIPQWLSDRLGWKEMAAVVAGVFQSLPAQERCRTVIISNNYGEAGALELYGPEFRLPPVFATHNSFHDWGPPADTVSTVIAVFVSYEDLKDKFDTVYQAALITCTECSQPQRSIPVWVARGPKFSFSRKWPEFKIYN